MSTTPSGGPVPRASYRLQLNKDFGFAEVERIAPYLGRLGVSHVYLSPILKARAGSTHGYDTVDHTLINPEIGTLEGFRAMAARLRSEGIGIILDIVPNHMGVGGSENPYWLDLLEWGRDSRYANWFDVDWSPAEPSLRDKVLAPFLGCSFAEAVSEGRLALCYDASEGSFAALAEDSHKLPIDPRHYGKILGRGDAEMQELGKKFAALEGSDGADALKRQLSTLDAKTVAKVIAELEAEGGRTWLRALFEAQNWRAARYSVAADDINYRRFFIVSDLGAVRIEEPSVFDHAHELIFQLIDEGLIDGLRIDHIDGLFDPKQYALRLRQAAPRPIYLVVEKILAPHEQLRADWQVDGTTGYEFANGVVQLFVDPDAEEAFTAFHKSFAATHEPLDDIEQRAKLEIIDYEMGAELDALARRFCAIAAADPHSSDLTRNGIRNGLRHLVAAMPVYRTYLDGSPPGDLDREDLAVGLGEARRMAPTLDPAIFQFLSDVILAEAPDRTDAMLEATMRLQQFTGPVMAKGLEDTTLYRYSRMIAVNDVGQKPDRFGSTTAHFHDFNRTRQASVPHGMLTSSSHDTKRGEDVRARIAALTLMADAWFEAATRWRDLLRAGNAPEIDPSDLYYLFQQLIGAWPVDLLDDSPSVEALKDYRERSVAAMTKAVREGRQHSTWTAPQEDYEARVAGVVEAMLDTSGTLFAPVRDLATQLASLGARNGIIAAALKLTAPGMPDIYQGAELHELSMVDPDNRRPVDFDLRENILAKGELDFERDALSGAAKLETIHRLLALRKALPALFAEGSYEAVDVGTEGRALAYIRRQGSDAVLVATWLGHPDALPDARLHLPPELVQRQWLSALTGKPAKPAQGLRTLLADLPVAVLRLA